MFGTICLLLAALPGPQDMRVPAKTELFVTLERSLDSQSATVGDRFHARLAVPVTVDDRIVIPVGSYILGQVDVTQKPGYFHGKGEVALSFDTVIFPDGKTRRMVALVQSAEGHSSGGTREGKIIASGSQADETIAGATAGGVAGGAVGAIAGNDLKGFGVGAAVGAAAGAIIGLVKRGKHVTLPRGASITIQLRDDAYLVKPEQVEPVERLNP